MEQLPSHLLPPCSLLVFPAVCFLFSVFSTVHAVSLCFQPFPLKAGFAVNTAPKHPHFLLCFCSADLVLYCEAFLTTYRTFITPEDLIKKLHYRYPSFKRSCRLVGRRLVFVLFLFLKYFFISFIFLLSSHFWYI